MHLGGELPAFSDKLGSSNPLPKNCLAFSHGRAALTWFVREYGVKSVALCAYTCPKLIECFKHLNLEIEYYDIGSSPTRAQLVVIPALFGGETLLDPDQYPLSIVDAAQTAFGYKNYPYTTLSCPRKTTSLSDGAILRVPGRRYTEINRLPLARASLALKTTARVLWKSNHSDMAMHFNKMAEDHWPSEPCRMSPESLWFFERVDVAWHESRRKANYRTLEAIIKDLPRHEVIGVPYCYPILVKNREELLETLHFDKIFANKLWYDAEIDRDKHPVSARYRDELICLPVDQRHTEQDMERIGKIVRILAEGDS